ncbi:general secretion pathway protein GspG [Rhodoferax lacus]|uniref:General secretion pathway protein GspG n=1 Tax=Rhodoferax lacus TaxID=2184758 RepID=A0A3E1RFG8_9BURK|nr:type II secretion system protein [Rhodoferax lacus]RFO98108.1 general secretion pathway protein GspG [Rhodoferax lacus]
MKALRASVRPRGFTLIEMLVTVTIVALLSTVAFPMLELAERRSNERELREALRQIRTALDNYKQAVDEGRILEETKGSGYPPTLEVLVTGVPDAKSPKRDQMMYFLRKLPRDPLMAQAGPEGATQWGLRSYASPATNPQPGADVFDVYSRSAAVGLNGIAYKDW